MMTASPTRLAEYSGVRFTAQFVEEVAGRRAVLRIPLNSVQELELRYGYAAERPVLRGIMGLVLGVVGLLATWSTLRTWANHHALSIVGLALSLLFVPGAWLLIALTSKRVYLAVKSKREVRKLVFSNDPTRVGLSSFVRAVRRVTGVHIKTHRSIELVSHAPAEGARPAPVIIVDDPEHRDASRTGTTSALELVVLKSRRRDIQDYRFRVYKDLIDIVVPPFAEWLRRHLDEGGSASQGSKVRDGDTLQYGWFDLRLRLRERHLSLLGPDLSRLLEWTEDLSVLLHASLMHRVVPESYGLRPDTPRMHDVAAVQVSDFDAPLYLTRADPLSSIPKHSGWMVGQQGLEPADSFEVLSLYELASRRPALLDYLSLPAPIHVGFVGDRPRLAREDVELQPVPGSLLEARSPRRSP